MIINYTMHYAYYKHVFRTCGQPILRQCQWKIFVQQSKYNRCTQFSGTHVRECVLVKAVYYIQIQQTITTLLIKASQQSIIIVVSIQKNSNRYCVSLAVCCFCKCAVHRTYIFVLVEHKIALICTHIYNTKRK